MTSRGCYALLIAMKLFLPAISSLLLLFAPFALAQSKPAKKPPVGIPSDATLFNGKWYRLYLEDCNWERARQQCVTLGGLLAIVPDAPTWAFLQPMTKGLSLWLGATDEKTEGLWKWIDGTPMTFTAWHRRQPDNARGAENHLHTVHNAWNDLDKSGRAVGFICEWKDK